MCHHASQEELKEFVTLHLNHLQGGFVVSVVGGSSTVREEEAFIALVVSLSHGGVDAHISCDSTKNEVSNLVADEKHVEVSSVERSLARLFDYLFSSKRVQLWDDVPSLLSTDENATLRFYRLVSKSKKSNEKSVLQKKKKKKNTPKGGDKERGG